MQAELLLSFDHARTWMSAQVAHLAEHDLLPVSRSADAVEFRTAYGSFLLQASGRDLYVRVDGDDIDGLEILQGSISDYLIAHDADLAARLDWRGHSPTDALPANFREMRVVARRMVSPWVTRLTLCGDDIGHFARRGLHVRLLVPHVREGRAIVWPRRAATGSVSFPEGEDALLVRVYTIRAIRADVGEIDIDIARHAGGAVSDWAETAGEGARVGLMGPGGGFFPPDGWLLIGGDETALPAIARILESRPSDSRGHAVIGVRHAEACIDIAAPAGIAIDWVIGDEAGLVDLMEGVDPPAAGEVTAWFAGEATAARHMRTVFKDRLALAAGQSSSAVYWRRGAAG